MADEINVLSRTQVILVEPSSGSVSVVNAGAPGPPGIPGPDETRVLGSILCTGAVSPTTIDIDFSVIFDGKPKATFWGEIDSDAMPTWSALVRGWDELTSQYAGFSVRYSSSGTMVINFSVEGPVI